MARKCEASGGGRRRQWRRRARTTKRELNGCELKKRSLIILVAILGYGAALPRPLWVLCPLLDPSTVPSPAGTGGDRATGAHPLMKVPLAGTDRSRERAPASAKKGDGTVTMCLPTGGGGASVVRPSVGGELSIAVRPSTRCVPAVAATSKMRLLSHDSYPARRVASPSIACCHSRSLRRHTRSSVDSFAAAPPEVRDAAHGRVLTHLPSRIPRLFSLRRRVLIRASPCALSPSSARPAPSHAHVPGPRSPVPGPLRPVPSPTPPSHPPHPCPLLVPTHLCSR